MSQAEPPPPPPVSNELIVYDENALSSQGSRCKYVGLLNQGATCYMNSLLQSLFMTPEFRNAIYKWSYSPDKDGDPELCIPLQLQKLFGLLHLSQQPAISTVALTRSFGWDSNEVFQQQDVQELNRKLFEALEEAFKDTEEAKVIDELFSGELIGIKIGDSYQLAHFSVDYIKCMDVDHESEKRDKFLDFSLAIKPYDSDIIMHSLSECIESYLKPELLEGDNMVWVESVGRKVPAIKGLKIGKLPNIMSIHLKRFVFDFSGPTIIQKKLNDQVRFPMVLDMNKYVGGRKKLNLEGTSIQRLDSSDKNEFEIFLAEQIQLLRHPPAAHKEPMVDMCDPTVPDLVDYNGNPSPDQVLEDETVFPEEAELDERAITNLIHTKGEWVYELYAVLIHSGASSGGHYYAYIKDLDEDTWWNFNDATVTRIDKTKVFEAWGGKLHSKQKSPFHSLSMSNAYMLTYRKISLNGERLHFASKESVPQHVRDLVREYDIEIEKRAREEEERKDTLRLRIQWKTIEMSVQTKRSLTYRELLLQLWRDFNINEDYLDERNPFETIRLRRFNSQQKTPMGAFDFDAQGTVKLSHLPLNEYTVYFLEARQGSEPFEEYDEGGLTINVIGYNPDADTFDEPRTFRMKKSSTILDLMVQVSNVISSPVNDIRIIRFNHTADKQTPEDLSEHPNRRLKEDLLMYDSFRVYYEMKTVPLSDSPLCMAYTRMANLVTLKINSPPSNEMNLAITVDRRKTPVHLKQIVAETLGRPVESIFLYRNFARGTPIIDSNESLVNSGIHSCVYVDVHPPPPPGQHRLVAYLLPRDYTPGYIDLSDQCASLAMDPPFPLSAISTTHKNVPDVVSQVGPSTYDASDFDVFQTEPINARLTLEFGNIKVILCTVFQSFPGFRIRSVEILPFNQMNSHH